MNSKQKELFKLDCESAFVTNVMMHLIKKEGNQNWLMAVSKIKTAPRSVWACSYNCISIRLCKKHYCTHLCTWPHCKSSFVFFMLAWTSSLGTGPSGWYKYWNVPVQAAKIQYFFIIMTMYLEIRRYQQVLISHNIGIKKESSNWGALLLVLWPIMMLTPRRAILYRPTLATPEIS